MSIDSRLLNLDELVIKQLISSNLYKPWYLNYEQRKRAVAMFLLGYRIADIGDLLEVPRHHVYNYLKPIRSLHGAYLDQALDRGENQLLSSVLTEVR